MRTLVDLAERLEEAITMEKPERLRVGIDLHMALSDLQTDQNLTDEELTKVQEMMRVLLRDVFHVPDPIVKQETP